MSGSIVQIADEVCGFLPLERQEHDVLQLTQVKFGATGLTFPLWERLDWLQMTEDSMLNIGQAADASGAVSRDLGFSIPEIAQLVGLWQDRSRPSREVKALAKGHRPHA